MLERIELERELRKGPCSCGRYTALMENKRILRHYGQDMGFNPEMLELLAQGILWVAKAEGEQDKVWVNLGEDPEKGPFIEYDLYDAPNTRGVIQAMRNSTRQGHKIITKKNPDGTMDLVIPLNEGITKS